MKITEAQLRNIVKETIRESLIQEGWLGNAAGKVRDFHDKMTKGREFHDYDPNASIEDVIKNNGWIVDGIKGNLIKATQDSGTFMDKTYILSPEDLINDINMHLEQQGKTAKIVKKTAEEFAYAIKIWTVWIQVK